MTILSRSQRYAQDGLARDNCGSMKPSSVWTDHNRRKMRTERLQATAIALAWVLAGMLAMTLLLAIARYALARAADAATLAPSMMMF